MRLGVGGPQRDRVLQRGRAFGPLAALLLQNGELVPRLRPARVDGERLPQQRLSLYLVAGVCRVVQKRDGRVQVCRGVSRMRLRELDEAAAACSGRGAFRAAAAAEHVRGGRIFRLRQQLCVKDLGRMRKVVVAEVCDAEPRRDSIACGVAPVRVPEDLDCGRKGPVLQKFIAVGKQVGFARVQLGRALEVAEGGLEVTQSFLCLAEQRLQGSASIQIGCSLQHLCGLLRVVPVQQRQRPVVPWVVGLA